MKNINYFRKINTFYKINLKFIISLIYIFMRLNHSQNIFHCLTIFINQKYWILVFSLNQSNYELFFIEFKENLYSNSSLQHANLHFTFQTVIALNIIVSNNYFAIKTILFPS